MNAQELLTRVSGGGPPSGKPWVPTYKSREARKRTVLTPLTRNGGRSQSRIASITKSRTSATAAAPAPTAEQVEKARAAQDERVRKAQEIHALQVARLSSELAASTAKTDQIRASIAALERIASEGINLTINESPSEIQYVTPEQAIELGLTDQEEE